MRVLVTGGCGYIGSHTIVDLLESGFDVVSVDNGINASLEVVTLIEKITGKKVENLNIDLSRTSQAVDILKSSGPFDGIIHFAALKSVEESVFQSLRYFENNIGCTITTLRLMEEMAIPHLIFSSSCTVYGNPSQLPVTESTPIGRAENPYGATKQMGEIMYDQYFQSNPGKRGISLRYFNPAGAHPSGIMGEASRNPSTNLVPVITEAAAGLRKQMNVYGTDYNTRDGSCIRDYIYIMDLAKAHTLAMQHLIHGKQSTPYKVYNLGIGEGVTVIEAIKAFEEVTGEKVPHVLSDRRPGDVPAIYADNTRIHDELGWSPRHTIRDIMHTAWNWQKIRMTDTNTIRPL